jgi:DNA-binding NarL/FixJ family response regulator
LEVAARCDWERALCLIQYGVKAILMYDDLITHLSQAIREISQGNYFLSASIVTSLLKMICHTDLLK